MANDRSRYEMRKEQDKQCEVAERISGRIVAQPVDKIRYQLKAEKADSHRQYDVKGILWPADLRHCEYENEIQVFERAERSEVDGDACDERPLPFRPFMEARYRPGHGDLPQQQWYEPDIPPAVKDERRCNQGYLTTTPGTRTKIICQNRKRQECEHKDLTLKQHAIDCR